MASKNHKNLKKAFLRVSVWWNMVDFILKCLILRYQKTTILSFRSLYRVNASLRVFFFCVSLWRQRLNFIRTYRKIQGEKNTSKFQTLLKKHRCVCTISSCGRFHDSVSPAGFICEATDLTSASHEINLPAHINDFHFNLKQLRHCIFNSQQIVVHHVVVVFFFFFFSSRSFLSSLALRLDAATCTCRPRGTCVRWNRVSRHLFSEVSPLNLFNCKPITCHQLTCLVSCYHLFIFTSVGYNTWEDENVVFGPFSDTISLWTCEVSPPSQSCWIYFNTLWRYSRSYTHTHTHTHTHTLPVGINHLWFQSHPGKYWWE